MSNIVLARLGENIKASAVGQIPSSTGGTTAPAFGTELLIGMVAAFARNTAPTGWLICDGSLLSRTVANNAYQPLHTAIGYAFGGSGDSFNLPDLRGLFIRGSGSQTFNSVLYSGTFAGKQGQDTQPHSHGVNDPGHLHTQSVILGHPGVNFLLNYMTGIVSQLQAAVYSVNANVTGISIQNSTGAETRPANVSLLYCIKWN